MKIPMYQVDAFARKTFAGNPAAVCPLDNWIDERKMQDIAAENNLAETAFIVPHGQEYAIRWFTPTVEVDLCGHATLASGHVVLTHLDSRRQEVRFASKSGELSVARAGDKLAMALPRIDPNASAKAMPRELVAALGATPRALYETEPKLLAVFGSAAEVAALRPDFRALAALGPQDVIVTAPGDGYDCDFVSRFFAPAYGIDEDPVTGSAHCTLTPYWARELGRPSLFARQISQRGGELWCQLASTQVILSGYVAPYLVGEIDV
jgi:PhzF family phenazine biosynthesis protein